MPSQTNFKPFEIGGLRYGLNTKDRPEDLPPGAAQLAYNAWHYRSLRQMPGFNRVISKRPWLANLMLNGVTQYLAARLSTPNTPASLNHASMLASNIFSADIPFEIQGLQEKQTLLWKGQSGGSTFLTLGNNDAYMLGLRWNATIGGFELVWTWRDPTVTQRTLTFNATALLPNTPYYVRVSGNRTTGQVTLAVYTTDVETSTVTLVGTASVVMGVATNAFPQELGFKNWLFVGAMRMVSQTREVNVAQFKFRGKLQELRFWSGDISAAPSTYGSTEISHTTPGLETVYHLTDVGPTIFVDSKGATPNLFIQPVDATWNASPLIGTGSSIELQGNVQYLRVNEPVLYRKRDVDTDSRYQMLDAWSASVIVRLNEVRECAILHSVHASQSRVDAYGGNGAFSFWSGEDAAAATQAQWELQIAANPGGVDYQFRAIFWVFDTAWRRYALVSTLPGAGVAANTTYAILFGRDNVTGDLNMWINGTNYTFAAWRAGAVPAATDNNPLNSSRQYGLFIGREVEKIIKANNNPNDPDDIDVTSGYDDPGLVAANTVLPFCGRVGHVGLFSVAPSQFLHNYLRVNPLTKATAKSLQGILLSAWPMSAGIGSVLTDYGNENNTISFRDDADHLRGRSLIKTLSRGRVTSIFQHSWRGDSADETKLLAAHAGGCDEIDTTNNKLVKFVEGFRNDENRRLSVVKSQDTLVLCSGSGPLMQLAKDQLVRLGMEEPIGPFAWGFTQQNERAAVLTEGEYVYYWVFYNSVLDKESPPSKPIHVPVRFKKTNVSFGYGIEAFQTYPSVPGTGAFGWSKDSQAEPWDLTGNNRLLKIAAWVQPKESAPGGAAPAAKYKTARFTSGAGVKDNLIRNVDDVKVDEVRAIVEADCPRVTVVTAPDGSFSLEGCFAGSNGKIRLNNDANTTATAAIFGLTINTTYSGTGVTSDLPLPPCGDTQATHLRLYRTLANDADARLVLELPLAAQNKVTDRLPDSLNIDQVLDLDVTGPPRDFRQIIGQFGRLLLLDHKTAPARMAWSEQGFPWQFIPSDQIDFNDGRIGTRLRITGAAATEGLALITRSDYSLVLTEPRSSQVPFIVDPKSQDTGGSSFFGFVNVNGNLIYPAARGFHHFDGSSPEYISQVIQPTWRATRNRELIHGEHWRDQEAAMWAVSSGGSFDTDGVTPINDGLFSFAYNAGTDRAGRRIGWGVSTGLYLRALYLIPNASDVEELWAIDPFGFIYKFSESAYSYGIPSHTVTLATTGTFGVAQATMQIGLPINADSTNLPEKYLGFGVTVQRASDGLRETRLIVACATGGGFDVCGLDHNLSWAPQAGDTWELCTIEFDWISGKMALAGEAFTSESFDLHIDQTVQAISSATELRWRWSGGMTVIPPFKSRPGGFTNQKGDDSYALEGRGRRLELELRARGINKPLEIGSMTVLTKPQQAAKRPAP